MKKILIIQTAFIGDVILGSALVEKLHGHFPNATIDIVLRKGNEDLFENHPFLGKIIIWDKKKNKIINLIRLLIRLRKTQYDYLVNVHRFASSGIISLFSKAKCKAGFKQNPFSFIYQNKIFHSTNNGLHEVERNQLLIEPITDKKAAKPKLYPSDTDKKAINLILSKYNPENKTYYCFAPSSVWFTKQFPEEKWNNLIQSLNQNAICFLLGAPTDFELCERIALKTKAINLAGKLSFLQSAFLMKGAKMNYVNDSAPMHLASSINAAVTAIYCSTIPEFGFGPLSEHSYIIESQKTLTCRPCGLHGFNKCPQGHFECGYSIKMEEILKIGKD